ncbi:hypothetical protein A3K24_03395 [candidate division Kazan bacterium RIFCSPHIGHO2_01_FULL_44_14]|uniref:Cell division protein FtsL n=1 Tax=candidate division Kazan bacterium RIFCSPLOWO2_01_FULL_45_19 TaxID=1798538 RepID=A0A1F4NR45_UNCK3|nr:MAG: hypothetical protein A3K51_03395 [candidate division Kazan bacterium RIFCSPLOWO2_01_FULL_45_19]OGB78081.1 MAG: hypothetical protein A3K24_03395 [candidate division Kazan bacterium RIFCSPHIGHO2_01_FULL_44_14]
MKPRFKINFNLGRRIRMRPMSLTYLAVGTFFVVGFIYVVVVNVVSNKGTELRMLEIENGNLANDNDRLDVEAARLKSLSVIEDNASGEVNVGNLEPTNPNSTTPTATTDKQVVAVVPKAVPKLVRTQSQQYLPSYTVLAQR